MMKCLALKRIFNPLELVIVFSCYRNFIGALPEMEIKHFAQDSAKPLINGEMINLYSMRFCPYAHRAHLVLNAKNLTYNPIYINLASKPKWYTDLFPAGRVPALYYKGEILYESLLLADFLNDEFPNNPLYSTDPLQKLKDKMLIANFDKVSSAFYKVAMVENNKDNLDTLKNALSEFEEELTKRDTKFFGGNERPMMIDYMIWPWFERMKALPFLYDASANVLDEKFPSLDTWIIAMEEDPSVKKHYLTPEQHAQHFRLRKINDPGAFDGIY